jgi:hypothetical protein
MTTPVVIQPNNEKTVNNLTDNSINKPVIQSETLGDEIDINAFTDATENNQNSQTVVETPIVQPQVVVQPPVIQQPVVQPPVIQPPVVVQPPVQPDVVQQDKTLMQKVMENSPKKKDKTIDLNGKFGVKDGKDLTIDKYFTPKTKSTTTELPKIPKKVLPPNEVSKSTDAARKLEGEFEAINDEDFEESGSETPPPKSNNEKQPPVPPPTKTKKLTNNDIVKQIEEDDNMDFDEKSEEVKPSEKTAKKKKVNKRKNFSFGKHSLVKGNVPCKKNVLNAASHNELTENEFRFNLCYMKGDTEDLPYKFQLIPQYSTIQGARGTKTLQLQEVVFKEAVRLQTSGKMRLACFSVVTPDGRTFTLKKKKLISLGETYEEACQIKPGFQEITDKFQITNNSFAQDNIFLENETKRMLDEDAKLEPNRRKGSKNKKDEDNDNKEKSKSKKKSKKKPETSEISNELEELQISDKKAKTKAKTKSNTDSQVKIMEEAISKNTKKRERDEDTKESSKSSSPKKSKIDEPKKETPSRLKRLERMLKRVEEDFMDIKEEFKELL